MSKTPERSLYWYWARLQYHLVTLIGLIVPLSITYVSLNAAMLLAADLYPFYDLPYVGGLFEP